MRALISHNTAKRRTAEGSNPSQATFDGRRFRGRIVSLNLAIDASRNGPTAKADDYQARPAGREAEHTRLVDGRKSPPAALMRQDGPTVVVYPLE